MFLKKGIIPRKKDFDFFSFWALLHPTVFIAENSSKGNTVLYAIRLLMYISKIINIFIMRRIKGCVNLNKENPFKNLLL